MTESNSDIVEAIRDLTRVTVALHGDFDSRAEAIRTLSKMGIKPSSLAAILDMQTKDVTSVLSKAKRRSREQGT